MNIMERLSLNSFQDEELKGNSHFIFGAGNSMTCSPSGCECDDDPEQSDFQCK